MSMPTNNIKTNTNNIKNVTRSAESVLNTKKLADIHGNFCDQKFFNFNIGVQDFNMSTSEISTLKTDINKFIDDFIAQIKQA